ncbi:hypothetical protein WN51_14281 [Melipona quadrifasciata]|uniref:Uncharacterized protein n=1 Tax=Melipona quadrifasciata TaxID=166423 RepID=A0A0N0BGQ4_9HYME|nr:hypothetical protein WN51_14281 [Melipona quadrifasciata]
MTQDGNEYLALRTPLWTLDFPKPKEGEPRRRSGFPSASNSESFRLSIDKVLYCTYAIVVRIIAQDFNTIQFFKFIALKIIKQFNFWWIMVSEERMYLEELQQGKQQLLKIEKTGGREESTKVNDAEVNME